LLTHCEFEALKREWERARGVKPPLTKAEQAQLKENQDWLRNQWIKAHARVTEKRRKQGRSLGKSIPVRRQVIAEAPPVVQ
jgi:hypothetical protein